MWMVILIVAVVIAAVIAGIYMMTPAGRMLRGVAPPPEPEERGAQEKPRRTHGP